MTKKWWYSHYTFYDTATFSSPTTYWSCGECSATGQAAQPEDACWAAHEHEQQVHGKALYPLNRDGTIS